MRHTITPIGHKVLDPDNSLIKALISLYKATDHLPCSLVRRLKDEKLVKPFGEPIAEHDLSPTKLYRCFRTLHALDKRERGAHLGGALRFAF